jgi:hypothetical protein
LFFYFSKSAPKQEIFTMYFREFQAKQADYRLLQQASVQHHLRTNNHLRYGYRSGAPGRKALMWLGIRLERWGQALQERHSVAQATDYREQDSRI